MNTCRRTIITQTLACLPEHRVMCAAALRADLRQVADHYVGSHPIYQRETLKGEND